MQTTNLVFTRRACALGCALAMLLPVIGSGWVLSQVGQAVLFIPNEIGASLLYNERITP